MRMGTFVRQIDPMCWGFQAPIQTLAQTPLNLLFRLKFLKFLKFLDKLLKKW